MLPPLAPERARALAATLSRAHVLVVGDAMLDKFLVGRVTRISPEAPVPVVMFDHDSHRIGGAANVAHNITSLGGRATLVAVTGQDEGAERLTSACREAGITPALIGDDTRPTTTKMRIVTDRNQQVARVDYEMDGEITGDTERRVLSAVQQHAPGATAIVISDYLKGCLTARVVRTAVDLATKRGIPLLVDPKIPHVDYYAGATLITPNHHEAEIATNMRVRTDDDARASARAFRMRSACDAVLMTRGDQGMWLLGKDIEGSLSGRRWPNLRVWPTRPPASLSPSSVLPWSPLANCSRHSSPNARRIFSRPDLSRPCRRVRARTENDLSRYGQADEISAGNGDDP
jgi:rfaE bifunctional protein kinase chain/domain